jgi:hypothetical protein
MVYALAAVAALTLVNAALLFTIARALRALPPMEARVGRLADALALLTDTTESGFRALSEHVAADGRAKVRPRRAAAPSAKAATARMVRSAQRGRTAAEIAANEELSEGEVRLRLQLAEAARRGSAAPAYDAD